jgi:hypothetical protein
MVNYISVAVMVQKWHKNYHKQHKNDFSEGPQDSGIENYICKFISFTYQKHPTYALSYYTL